MMTEGFEDVNHLVLNFYPDGYSIAVKLNEFPVFTSETILETAKISYEETSLLDYIENEELPPLLVEMIDGSPKLSQYKIWHNGCLILEIRDKINPVQTDRSCTNNFSSSQTKVRDFANQNYPNSQQINAHLPSQSMTDRENCLGVTENSSKKTNRGYFILLKPTNLSMLNDVLNLTESNVWSTQDRLQLESQIVLHNSPPLLLEPDDTDQPVEEGSCHWPNLSINGNAQTKRKNRLPHMKLKSIYTGRKNGVKHNSNNHNYGDRIPNYHSNTTEVLPPELTLQQFLATKRAKKNTFAAGHLARFHRFRSHYNN